MKYLGPLKYFSEVEAFSINSNQLQTGPNQTANYIINVDQEGKIRNVIDRVCDHSGGKLSVKDGVISCPMHGWRLDPESLRYNDSHICKKSLNYTLKDDGNIVIESDKRSIQNPAEELPPGEVKVRWLNHACVWIECNGKTLVTDPWLVGPAFLNGWWLAQPSPTDSLDLLRHADYIYISHNHPDHLNPETLKHVDKNKPIIVADFESKSCEKSLKSLGFTNVQALAFNQIFELAPGFQFSILHAGDFRDDSGILIAANNNSLLLTVDCNYLNNFVLPDNIDLLMTSFASGASGFPICYNNYSDSEKEKILKRNKESIKVLVGKYLQLMKPRYYMPYAGMFSEKAERDNYVKIMNSKNSPEEFISLCGANGVEYLSPAMDKTLIFNNKKLETRQMTKFSCFDAENIDLSISEMKKSNSYDSEKILSYFRSCKYSDKQIVQILPTDDDFNVIGEKFIWADFFNRIFEERHSDELKKEIAGFRVMQVKIRVEVLMSVINRKLPWEDFSIGFQMRAERWPNTYESDFWYYFTNEYVGFDG